MKATYLGLIAVGLAALVGCGGGGEGGGGLAPGPVPNASPGGIWQGKDAIAGLDMIGIVTESGEARFLRVDDAQFYGTVTTSGNSLSGNYTVVLPTGFVFTDGSSYGTGTVTGTLQARQSITATFNFTSARGTTASGTSTFTFNSIYNAGSSLATIAGNYRDPDTNAVINVNSNGVVFAQDAFTGCVVNGQVGIINSTYNAYNVQYSFSSCRGGYAYLNGTTATGLGTLDTSANPRIFYIGVSNNTARYVLTAGYPRI